MTVRKRDTHHPTYADYLVWSRTYGDELTAFPDVTIDWDQVLARM